MNETYTLHSGGIFDFKITARLPYHINNKIYIYKFSLAQLYVRNKKWLCPTLELEK